MGKRDSQRDTLAAYNAFGGTIRSLSPEFSSSLTHDWLLRLNTPIFLNKPVWNERLDTKLTRFFAREQGRHVFCTETPYFWMNRTLYGRNAAFDEAAAQSGYLRSGSFQVCLWDRRWALDIPKGYTLRVGDIRDKKLRADAETVAARAFANEKSFWKKANDTLTDYLDRTAATVIYDSKQKPVATGMVTWTKTHSFLYTGGIVPAHQGKGLWRALIAARQTLGEPTEDRVWLLTTQNPRIRSKADRHFEVDVFDKTRT